LGVSDTCLQIRSHVYTWAPGRFALAIVLGVLASAVNHVLLQGITGASVAKMLVGLRVVDGGGRVCGVGRAIVRWLFLIVDQFFCFLVGLITMLVTRPHRRVGDMVAGTYVVSTADVGRPVVPQAAMPPYAYAGQGAWTPPAPGVPAWGTPPPPPQPTWGAPPPSWGAQPPPPTWGSAPPPPYQQPPPDQPGWAAPQQPAPQPPPPPPPSPASATPSPSAPAPPSWGTPPPPAQPAPAAPETPSEEREGMGESWWDKALGDEANPDEE